MNRWQLLEWLRNEKRDRRISEKDLVQTVEMMSCSEIREAVIEFLLIKK